MTDEAPASERRPIRLPRFPRTRAECVGAERPCPHTRCEWSLVPRKRETRGRAGVTVPRSSASCLLDITDNGPATLEEVGGHLALTRERVRQIEESAIAKLDRFYGREIRELAAAFTTPEDHR